MPIREPKALILSQHAQRRCQQRGIKLEILSVVYGYGKCERTRDGFSYTMDQRARLRAKRQLGEIAYRRIADKLDLYMVVASDGKTVITAAHRLKRHRV